MQARIAVLPGDGIGPEVVAAAVQVLERVAEVYGHRFEFQEGLIGGIAIDRTGDPLPEETLALCRASDAILLGAVGGPQWDDPTAPVRPEQGLLRLRKELQLFANLRPVKPYPALRDASPLRPDVIAGVDLMVVRELTGGIYFGPRGREGNRAYDTAVYTVEEIERVLHVAFRLSRQRRRKVTSVDKANVLTTSRLWRETAIAVGQRYPDVELEHLLVDACAMMLMLRPGDFDVVVTENMFGDILTDEAAVLAGSIGLLPSASLGADGPGLYEPIHGSAPSLAGRGIANPIATILSAAMLLRHSLGLEDEAAAVEQAVSTVLEEGYRTPDIARPDTRVVGTEEMARHIARHIGSYPKPEGD
ncbi:MAG: 3-isopropylmalate dehydrogenase [Anaerolineae bacterium]|nr:3-isopropylmalate dehydrogenase [Anaerolineae bacterium]